MKDEEGQSNSLELEFERWSRRADKFHPIAPSTTVTFKNLEDEEEDEFEFDK